ncbi:hypothetical protein GRI42_05955 [Erythrobacter gaetbuli]|uniref:Uncharacterized protein n=2 Tax=Qipengyuania gaetbuli TaxID=266952 RepID=A0A844Y131_9SPHN|nr:hypothetical protein [Qipengyuania gaetbuli]
MGVRNFGAIMASAMLVFPAQLHAKPSADVPAQLQTKIDEAASVCAELDGGKFAMEDAAIQRVDLDGDGDEDWALNESGFACSTAASMYGGTGGTMAHFLVDGTLASMLTRGWGMAKLGPHAVLLADVHGSQCDGINPTPCVTASVWDAESKTWRSTGASWE